MIYHSKSDNIIMSNEITIESPKKPLEFFFIGDSHSIIFNNLLFQHNSWTKSPIISRSSYLGGVQATNFTDISGKLRPDIFQSLKFFGLLSKYGDVLHMSNSEAAININVASSSQRKVPIITFCVGDIDIRSKILRQLGDDIDFDINSDHQYEWFKVSESENFISSQLVKKLIQDTYKPLFKGLNILLQGGFQRIYLHSIAPPTLNSEKFELINGYNYSRRIHSKVVYITNLILEEECKRIGVHFINAWQKFVTKDGKLSDVYHLDHTHLNKKAAQETIRLIIDNLFNHPDPKALNSKYSKLYIEAKQDFLATPLGHKLSNSNLSEKFAELSILLVKDQFSASDILSLNNDLIFNQKIANYVPLYDWIGGRGFSEDVNNRCCEFSENSLEIIHNMLNSENVSNIIKSCLGSNFISTVRGRKSFPHSQGSVGSQSFHRDGNPPGILRGLIYLNDVTPDNGPFEVLLDKNSKQSTLMNGGSGTFLLFDAQRYFHRGSPPRKGTRIALDIVFIPTMNNIQPITIHPSQNSWPVDPYSFDINPFNTWPRSDKSYLSAA